MEAILPNLDIEHLLEHGSDSRKLRAYAYLTASFNATPNTSDIIDCLLPFMAAGVAQQAGQLLELGKLSSYLQSLGLRVPLYALKQLVPRFEGLGLVEWNSAAKRHICKATPAGSVRAPSDSSSLESSYGTIEDKFKAYASNKSLSKPPASSSWSDALISFLRSETAANALRSTTIKDTLVLDAGGVETYMVARFIQEARTNDNATFNAIVQVYTGTLIEDFINNIQSIGDTRRYAQLSIYYDTTVLLRLLGTSGSLLLTATMEMHRSLQDLGCRCFYLGYTADEVSRILDTLVSNHEIGEEIFGETSEAIIEGDISIAAIRDIRATFEQRLGELNIFAEDYNFAARKNEQIHQISEGGLVTAIEAEAAKRRRIYKRSSAETDARSVAVIMRLRKGVARRNIAACGHLFVSHNPVFQTAARNYVIRDVDGYDGGAIPPVLTLGQITTVSWLATARTLEPIKVTKELLATCYNAVRPSPAWTQQFAQALDSFRGVNPGSVEQRANAALFLQVARNNARDDSYGQPAILRKVNLAELFADAVVTARAQEEERRAQIARLEGQHQEMARLQAEEATDKQLQIAKDAQAQIELTARLATEQMQEAARRNEQEKIVGIAAAAEAAARRIAVEQREAILSHRQLQSSKLARVATLFIRIVTSISLGILLFLLSIDYWETGTTSKICVSAILSALLVLANMDLFGIEVVKIPMRSFESWIAYCLLGWLVKLDPPAKSSRERVEPFSIRNPTD